MYVHMYMIYIFVYTYMYIYIYKLVDGILSGLEAVAKLKGVFIYIYIYVFMYVYVIHVCTYVHDIHICIYIYVYVYIYKLIEGILSGLEAVAKLQGAFIYIYLCMCNICMYICT
jgi:hypothetical protein